MGLSSIQISHLRNIHQQSLSPCSGLNILEGENGSGKTSFLEAVFLLGRGKSFRTQTASKIITQGESRLVVSGSINTDAISSRIGVQKTATNTDIRINGKDCKKVSELVTRFPLQIIRPESHCLLEGIPQIRRSFIDWGLFHVKHNYLDAYKRYQRALHQRNALLKRRQTRDLGAWNHELGEYGTIVDNTRRGYLDELSVHFSRLAHEFLSIADIHIAYQSGWDIRQSLGEAIKESEPNDIQRGFTRLGPHRADMVLKTRDVLARDRLSRGQMKLLVLCLNLAQIEMFKQKSHQEVVVLIDDLAAELDPVHQDKALSKLANLRAQVFITSTQSKNLPVIHGWPDIKMFHVKQGEFKEKALAA